MQEDKQANRGSKLGLGSVMAGIAGVAVGATAMALYDKKTRKIIGKKVLDVAGQGRKVIGELQNKLKDKVKMEVEQLSGRARGN